MTSNLGNRLLAERDRMSPNDISEGMTAALREFFRPEFLNRVDEIIIFGFLGKDELLEIVDLQVEQINRRLAEKELHLELSN